MFVPSRKGLALFSFRLSDEFISQYKDREPDWGYRDAAGNAVGEITFLRTYSRVKDDGGKERWYEVCERVVNGMYSIQKDHCKANRLPWNDHKAQVSAQEAFDRLFQFKWMPPGRGLWMMGTPLVMVERNSAALQNPLHEDTKVMTREGWRRLGDLEGQDIEVLTSTHLYARDHQLAENKTAKWAKASVSFIEEQPSVRITYRDTVGEEHTLVASRNHRWFVCRGDVSQKGWKRITSEELQEGDILPSVKPPINYKASLSGRQHGFFFGDGSRTDGEFKQFGSSGAVMVSLFGSQNLTFTDRSVRIGQCPSAWGFLPEGRYREDKRYVLGFLQGYFAADGCVDGNGGMSISSARPEELVAVRDLFLDLGIEVSRPKLVSTSSNYKEERELWQMRINRWDVTADFFLKDEHRERWIRKTLGKSRKNKYIHILSIEDAGVQRVLCATVPTYEQFVIEGFALTSNCGFVSTANMPKNDPGKPLAWLMEASMLGIGVGFDTKGADKGFTIHEVPNFSDDPILKQTVVIPDDREGWVESMRLLINNHLRPNPHPIEFDYSLIRPAGSPIKTFGGTAAGPEPLMRGHQMIRDLFKGRDGQALTRRDIADIGNILGVVVVSGNVRRSAELLMGSIDDPEFIQLKNPEVFPERQEWAFMSNNSVEVTADTDLSPIIEGIKLNGEPGVIWMDITRNYGRLIDPPDYKDWRAAGFNPCAEQSLESYELCTLDEAFLNRHEYKDDLLRSLKFAYLYGKTVTLLPTHWPETNAVMQRNRRIGTSVSGVADFADAHGLLTLRDWLNDGYAEVRKWDHIYSEWLAIRESIRVTTVKPSGTVSLLAGASPGVHWAPGGRDYLRGIVFGKDDPIAGMLGQAGYTVETSAYTPDTSVFIQFPIHTDAHRDERQVSLYEKANLAVVAQRYWSDNSVSVTLSFDAKEEADAVERVLTMHAGQLKTVSFLPMGNDTYAQMPYQRVEPSVIEEAKMRLFKVDFSPIYDGDTQALEALGEQYCAGDKCIVPGM